MTAPDTNRPDAMAILRELEWSLGENNQCPFCGQMEEFGKHLPDCRLAAALASPSVPESPTQQGNDHGTTSSTVDRRVRNLSDNTDRGAHNFVGAVCRGPSDKGREIVPAAEQTLAEVIQDLQEIAVKYDIRAGGEAASPAADEGLRSGLELARGIAEEELAAVGDDGGDGEVWVVRRIVDAIEARLALPTSKGSG